MPIERLAMQTQIWLQGHDGQVREKARAEAIDEFADKMIIMMSGHKQDILQIAEQLKEGGKDD